MTFSFECFSIFLLNVKKIGDIIKKKLVIVFGLLYIGLTFASTIEASAKELDGPECPAGYYFKKGGWTAGGFTKAGGYCIPMGNIGKIR